MSKQQSNNTYCKVKIDPKIEAKAVSILMSSGESFSAISKTEYLVSKNQCETLTDAHISYTTD